AEATQAVGALLLLGLLAAPAGAAHRLAASPYRALALSALLAVASMWLGLALSYAVPKLPPSTSVVAAAAPLYLLAVLPPPPRRHPPPPFPAPPPPCPACPPRGRD